MLDAQGGASLIAADSIGRSDPAPTLHRLRKMYFLHLQDGMMFSGTVGVGTDGCRGVQSCQFPSFELAKAFCDNSNSCTGIMQQQTPVDADGCAGGFGCFFAAAGELYLDEGFKNSTGRTFERQTLAYSRYEDGRKLSGAFSVGTKGCTGKSRCEFGSLDNAMAFCDSESECLGVMEVPASMLSGTNCASGCFLPAKGDVVHDPLWRANSGVTYVKKQEVAYFRRPVDGKSYTRRFASGTGGCRGVHNCQFHTLLAAQSYCNAYPTCKGILKKTPDGTPDCDGGLGCYEPCKGRLTNDPLVLVTESQVFERRLWNY
jgi:hypothetical protein